MAPKPQWIEYNKEHEQEFEIFWNSHGEQIVLDKWKATYGDYMENENNVETRDSVNINLDISASKRAIELDKVENKESNSDNLKIYPSHNDEYSCLKDSLKDTLQEIPKISNESHSSTEKTREKEVSNQNISGWGTITSTTETAATCKSTWGDTSNISSGNWGGMPKNSNADFKSNCSNDLCENNAIQGENGIADTVANYDLTLTDEEQWNILWQEMWKTTKIEKYNNFIKNKKESVKQNSNSEKTNTNDTEVNHIVQNENQNKSTSNELASNSNQESIDKDDTPMINNRTTAGVGMFLELLKQDLPEKETEKNENMTEIDNVTGIDEKEELECDDNELPDEIPYGNYSKDISVLLHVIFWK